SPGRDRLPPLRSADQPDDAVADLDRKCLQRSSADGRLDGAGDGFERALRPPNHRAGTDVEQRGVPRTLQTSVVGHMALPEWREQVAAAVGDRKRLARTDANRKGAVGRLLNDRDLRRTKVLDGHE